MRCDLMCALKSWLEASYA